MWGSGGGFDDLEPSEPLPLPLPLPLPAALPAPPLPPLAGAGAGVVDGMPNEVPSHLGDGEESRRPRPGVLRCVLNLAATGH